MQIEMVPLATGCFATMPGMTSPEHEPTPRTSRVDINLSDTKLDAANLATPSMDTALAAQDAHCCVWLAAIAQQDESALAALYDATVGRVYGLALRIVRKPEAAEEVVADVYLQVWRKAAQYDVARGRALTWLLTICHSRALDQLRRRDEAETHPEPETLRADLHEGDNDPLDLLQAIENQSAIYAALETLNPIQRQLIALAFFKGLSHQEAAEQSGLPLGTVKTHIRRALEQLRLALKTEFDGAPS